MIALLLGAAAARLHGMAPALITFESPEFFFTLGGMPMSYVVGLCGA